MEPGEGSFRRPIEKPSHCRAGCFVWPGSLIPSARGPCEPLGIIARSPEVDPAVVGDAHLAGNRSTARTVAAAASHRDGWLGDDRRQRNASYIGQQVMFRSVLPAVHGIRAGLRPPKNGPHRGTVDKGSEKVDPVGMPQTIKQQPMELFPYPLLLPVPQSSPTTHARSAAHLPGKIFPRDAGGQDVHNAR